MTAWERRFQTASAFLSATTIVLGLLVVAGWAFDIPVLISVHPSLASMKANAAVLFVLLGVGLWLARSHDARSVRARRIIGLLVATAAVITAAQYVFDLDLGIDELLFRDSQDPTYPGRMAPAAALAFLLLGLALVLEDGRRTSGVSRVAALVSAAAALVGLFGYLFGAPSLYAIGLYTSLALHTAIGLLLASCAFLMARPSRDITGLLGSDTDAGHLMRRLLPAIVLVPIVIGWLLRRGQADGYFDIHFGIALMVLATSISLTVFSAAVATSLRHSELRRRDAEGARERLLDEMRLARQELEADVDAMARLNKVASLFIPKTNPLPRVLAEVVDAAIAISGADSGNIQILDPRTSELVVVAHRGLPDWWLAFWNKVPKGHGACGTALARGARIIVEDVEQSPIFRGTPGLEIQRKAGIRAVQSTPLFARSGEPLGMFSTHYTRPHRPDERALHLLDLLARQAADIIERTRAEEQRDRMLREIRDLTRNLEARVAERTMEVAVARDRLDRIISMAADAIISTDDDLRITIFNRGAEQVFGWTREEVAGRPLDIVLPEHQHLGERTTVIGLRKNGEEFPAEATISKLNTETGFQLTVILRDITDRKRQEDEQARAYAERALLLKEIHHRVKNNLQVISSLFYLQAQRTEQESVRKLLDESRGRLQSIAIIHEKLYRSQHLASIDFGDYLRELTSSLTSAIGVQAPHVDVRIDAAEIFLDIDRAIPCALIVNELVSNSLKHAFPDGRRGRVQIAVRAADSDLELEVTDNGIGLPPDLDFRSVTTLGLQLVASLTKQLHGTVELGRAEGTSFRIHFPASPASRRMENAESRPSA